MIPIVYLGFLAYLWQACHITATALGCSTGCRTCDNAVYCTVCEAGYYLTGSNTCQACPPNCISCTASGCNTNGCNVGYVLEGTTCKACGTNCNSCIVSGTCSSNGCKSGYAYNAANQQCEGCSPNCNQCTFANTCWSDQCQYGYAFDSATKTCRACIAHCRTCYVANTCAPNGCNEGYFYDGTTKSCKACSLGCTNCAVENTCLPDECRSGYLYNSTTQSCLACTPSCFQCSSPNTCLADACYDRYVYNELTQRCEACVANCRYCSQPGTCNPNGCVNKYAYNDTSQECNKCADNCDECSEPDTCAPNKCSSGYTFEPATRLCEPCADNCQYCESPYTCVPNGCKSGYSYVYNVSVNYCVACDAGKPCVTSPCGIGYTYDVTLETCVACAANCDRCASNFTCLLNGCNGYRIYNETSQTCEDCAPHCYACGSPGTCLPTQCHYGYSYNETSQSCEACSTNCGSCKSEGTCKPFGCSGGRTFNVQTQSCAACIAGCRTCQTPNTCVIGGCYTGFVYDTVQNKCKACAANCDECVIPNTCTQQGCRGKLVYNETSQTCVVNSPCNTNPMQCSNHGTCDVISYSPYYLCTCFEGYVGQQCGKLNTPLLYPYGSEAGDSVLNGTDDGSTSRVWFDENFLFFGRYVTSAFINMNGFISFSINYLSYRPIPFPHPNTEDADLLAVFWADADSTGINCDCTADCFTCGTDVVYYQVYKYDWKKDYNLYSLEKEVFDHANIDGYTLDNGFEQATWVMVVTWSEVIPYSYSSNQYSYERNTFQAVLAMDTVNLKSFVSFRYADISWNSIRPAVVGIAAPASNYFFNYDGNVYEIDKTSSNYYNETGVLIYDTSGVVSDTPRDNCIAWYNQEVTRVNVINDRVESLPPCPCSGFQAIFTPDYFYLHDSNCFVTSQKFLEEDNGTLVDLGGRKGMKCCYDRNAWMWSYHWYQWSWMWTYVWLGDLIVNPVFEAGGYYENHPVYYEIEAEAEETAKADCCLYSTNCDKYYEVRPIKSCDGYVAPRLSSSYGDPHINTIDGLSYDYNGIGEYWLIKSNALHVQVRTVQAKDTNGNLVKASVFGAYAIQVPKNASQEQSDRIMIQMTSDSLALELFVQPSLSGSTTENLTNWIRNNTGSPQTDTIDTFNGFILRRLSGGSGLVVTISQGTMLAFRLQEGQLGLTVTPGAQLFGTTKGLLGTYDNNKNNDLTQPTGSIVAASSTAEEIYSTFGESWRTTSVESIMHYNPGTTHSSYQNSSFVPLFAPAFSSAAKEQEAKDVCGSNTQCLLDYSATGNEKLAKATVANTLAFTEINQLFMSSQPGISGYSTYYITVGKLFTSTYTTTNADGSAVTLSMTGMPVGATFNAATGVFSWTPTSITPVPELSVHGVSANGVPAHSISVVVFMCDGCSNHGSCDFGITASAYNNSYRFQTVSCTCNNGYIGSSCEQTYDYCSTQPCGEGATCVSRLPGQVNTYGLQYDCTACPTGQTISEGKCVDSAVGELNLQNSLSACNSQPCLNHGQCQGTSSAYSCTCLTGTTGLHCETVLDNCGSVTCQNGGACVNGINKFTCSCTSQYTGTYCQTVVSSTSTSTRSVFTTKKISSNSSPVIKSNTFELLAIALLIQIIQFFPN